MPIDRKQISSQDHGTPMEVPWLAHDQMSATSDEHRNRTRKEQMRSMGEEVLLSALAFPLLGAVVDGTEL